MLFANRSGVTLVEILIAFLLIGIISLLVFSVYSSQIKVFFTVLTGIGVSSQNKIAINELTNQTREGVAIVSTCPAAACPDDNTSGLVAVYQVFGLDASGNPTSAFYDYIVYRQDPADYTHLIRKVFKDPQSTRVADTKIIATDLASNGLNFGYNNADPTQATQVTFTVITSKKEGAKTINQTQTGKAKLRNKGVILSPPPPSGASPSPSWQPPTFETVSTPAAPQYCSNGTNTFSWSHTVGATATNRLLMVHFSVRNSATYGVSGVTYATSQTMTLLDSIQAADTNTSINGLKTYVFYLVAPNTGTNPISVTFTGNPTPGEVICAATSWTDVNQTTPLGLVAKRAKSSYFGTDPNSLNVASTTNEVVVDSFSRFGDTGDERNPGVGQTKADYIWLFTNLSLGVSYKPSTPPTTNMTWEPAFIGWDLWTHIGVALKPV